MFSDAGAIARLSRLLADGAVELLGNLDELRRFRHFFRNAYVLDLDLGKTRAHSERVLRVHPEISAGIRQLFRHLEAVRQTLATS